VIVEMSRRPAAQQLCGLCVCLAVFSAFASDETFLRERIQRITTTPAWNHKFVVPEDLLAKSLHILGDDTRLKAFARKLILGQTVHFAHLGGSISLLKNVVHSAAHDVDVDSMWHALMHKWLELVFTPCSETPGIRSARDRSPMYVLTGHVCPLSSVHRHNLAVGGTTVMFAEQCVVHKVNGSDTDLVLIEYTQNSPTTGMDDSDKAHIYSYEHPERKSLERLLRRLLLLPSQPAVLYLHVYDMLHTAKLGPTTQDWHNLPLSHYNNVQVLSMRETVFDMWRDYATNPQLLQTLHVDGRHPTQFGQVLLGDIMIYNMKRITMGVMAEMLTQAIVPTFIPGPIKGQTASKDEVPNLPNAYMRYNSMWSGMPAPLYPGNEPELHSLCLLGEEMKGRVVEAQGFELGSDISFTGSKKPGYIGSTPFARLVFEVDSTVGGLVKPKGDADPVGLAPPPPPGMVMTAKVEVVRDKELAKVMIGYLGSYERVSPAVIECVYGCTCPRITIDPLWGHKASQTTFMTLLVTPHPQCRVQVTVQPPDARHPIVRFKVTALVVAGVSHNVVPLSTGVDVMHNSGAEMSDEVRQAMIHGL